MTVIKKGNDLIINMGKKKIKFKNAHVDGYSSNLNTNFYKYIKINYEDNKNKEYKKEVFENVKATRELDYLIFSNKIC
jgi:hypothetical protein